MNSVVSDKPYVPVPPYHGTLWPRVLNWYFPRYLRRRYGTAKTLAAKHFPGIPMLPAMTTGATDGRFLNSVGIPTYGVPGRFSDPDGNGVHGLNERKSVAGLYAERDYLFELIQAYAKSK